MASRRIAISSLLCTDNEQDNERKATHASPPNSASSTDSSAIHRDHAPVPQADPTSPRPKPPSSRGSLASLINPTSSAPQFPTQQSNQHERHEIWEKRGSGGHRHPPYSPSQASQANLSATAPTTSFGQPLAIRRRTPSPPPSRAHFSVLLNRQPVEAHRDGDVELEDKNSRRSELAPRDVYAKHSDLHSASLQHSSYRPQPPSSSSSLSVDVLDAERDRRPLVHHLQKSAPAWPPHLSPASPRNFPPLPQPPALSPSASTSSTHRQFSRSVQGIPTHSPNLARSPEADIHTTSRASASMSPTTQKSPLPDSFSGLEALVQAATEERERIDGSKRPSAGDIVHGLPGVKHRSGSLSPVAFRHDQVLHPEPLTPPYTAATNSSEEHPPVSHATFYEQVPPSGEPSFKRRRPSPEAPFAERSGQALRTFTGTSHPHSTFDHRHEEPRSPVSDVRHDLTLPQTQSTQVPDSGRRTYLTAPELADKHTVPGSRLDEGPLKTAHHIASPISPHHIIPARQHSPPRSKPKPRKPGSAALASLERELKEVELSTSNENKEKPAASSKRSKIKSAPARRISDSARGNEDELPSKSNKARVSGPQNEQKQRVQDDEDVDSFFNSTFDSPRAPAARPVTGSHQADLSVEEQLSENQRKAVLYAPQRAGRRPPSSKTPHTVVSAVREPLSSPTQPIMESEQSDRGSFIEDVLHNEVEMKDTSEAEIFEEIADAAGAATSDDERTDYEDMTTEVDVDNELLELVDGGGATMEDHDEHINLIHHQEQKPEDTHTPTRMDVDQMAPQEKENNQAAAPPKPKKGTKRPKKAKAVEPPPTEDDIKLPEESTQEAPKANKPVKPKASASKAKVKENKEANSSPVVASPVPGGLVDEDFPLFTSSGRIITKSKKSAAAFSHADSHSPHPTSQPKKKVTHMSSASTALRDGASSRSRSQSAMPEPTRERSVRIEEEKPKEVVIEEVEPEEDDKLYCICRTKYDEDKAMIGCDRCDDWYHPQCIGMKDLDIDLVDSFFCPNCVAQNPEMNLCTTYKPRCFAGLKHPLPDTAEACHKPSRGAASKYCSDECGARYMRSKIQKWEANGGDVSRLWETVKDAKRREGFVVRESERPLPKFILAEIDANASKQVEDPLHVKTTSLSDSSAKLVSDLEAQLKQIVREREKWKNELEFNSWQIRLLELASTRAEGVDECGWDQRLTFGIEEWSLYGQETMESYAEQRPQEEHTDGMDVDGSGLFWCKGIRKCPRHAGWQKLRSFDFERERDAKDDALNELTTREREIRNQLEDILNPQFRPSAPRLIYHSVGACKPSEPTSKKGKRKATASAVQ